MDTQELQVKRVCIVGCGSIAGLLDETPPDIFISHAKAISAHPGYELVACVDVDSERASTFASRWTCKSYLNIKDVVESDIDLFVIASPTDTHVSYLKAIIEAEIEPWGLICEKPVTNDIAELAEFQKIAKKFAGKLVVNFHRRFDDSHRQLKAYLSESSELGELITFHAKIGKGIIHNGSHFIDLLQWMYGPIEAIDSQHSELKDNDLLGEFAVTLGNGVRGNIQTTERAHYGLFEMSFVHEKGIVEIRDIGFDIQIRRSQPSSVYEGYNELAVVHKFEGTLGRVFYSLYEELLISDDYDRSSVANAIDGARLLLECKERYQGC